MNNRFVFLIFIFLAASFWAAGKAIDLVMCPVRKLKQTQKKEDPYYWD